MSASLTTPFRAVKDMANYNVLGQLDLSLIDEVKFVRTPLGIKLGNGDLSRDS